MGSEMVFRERLRPGRGVRVVTATAVRGRGGMDASICRTPSERRKMALWKERLEG